MDEYVFLVSTKQIMDREDEPTYFRSYTSHFSVVLHSDIANLSYTLSLAQLRTHCIIILPGSYLFH